jgi:RNA polymerase sigma factor (sigma-70 family)
MSPVDSPLEALVPRALEGDRHALAALCRGLQGPVYRLALRTLGNAADAADACQDILVQIITHLTQFEGRSRLLTWVYTIGVRHLMARQKPRHELPLDAEALAAAIDRGLSMTSTWSMPEGEVHQLEREVRLVCTQNMLRCLSPEERIALILVEMLGADDSLAAGILGISKESFRQRLSRGRAKLRPVLEERCGLRNEANACRCARQAAAKQTLGAITPVWTCLPVEKDPQAVEARESLGELRRLGQVFATQPPIAAPDVLWERLQQQFPGLLT